VPEDDPSQGWGALEQHSQAEASRSFGGYLRRVREGRRLSLDAVEEMSQGFPERLTKSHLSRIETGQAIPTFPKLFALSRIYGVPVGSMAERFDLELQRGTMLTDISGKSDDEAEAEAQSLERSGRHLEALTLCTAVLERMGDPGKDPRRVKNHLNLRLYAVDALIKLDRHEMAKADCEEILGHPGLSLEHRLLALYYFVVCCNRLRRYTVARMALESIEKEIDAPGAPPRLRADLTSARASVLRSMGLASEAAAGFRRAMELYEALQDPFEACRASANLGLVLFEVGDAAAAKERLEASLRVAEGSGYDRLRAVVMSHLAMVACETKEYASAEAMALRSNAIARPREYLSLVFRNCYYLWRVALATDDEAGIKLNERTLRVYISRLEEDLPEATAFRSHMQGGGR
jgi:transcriptional regulator with XRE-family HTH domain